MDEHYRHRLRKSDEIFNFEPSAWKFTNHHIELLNKYDCKKAGKKAGDVAVDAITDYCNRVQPKLMMTPPQKIDGSLKTAVLSINDAIAFVHKKATLKEATKETRVHGTCPFQYDTGNDDMSTI